MVPRGRARSESRAWSAYVDISLFQLWPVLSVSRALSCLSSHSNIYALLLPVFVQAALWQSAHSANCVVSPLARGNTLFRWACSPSVNLNQLYWLVLLSCKYINLLVHQTLIRTWKNSFNNASPEVPSLHGDLSDQREAESRHPDVSIEPNAVVNSIELSAVVNKQWMRSSQWSSHQPSRVRFTESINQSRWMIQIAKQQVRNE